MTTKPHIANGQRRIAIIGAGIGGLAAAAILARRGFEVDVYEQAPALREFGAGLQISPNGACVLRALGIDLGQYGIRSAGLVPCDGMSGKALARFDHSRMQYYFIHREVLLNQLAAAALGAGVRVHVNAKIDADDLPAADLRIGAGGVLCPLRRLLNPDTDMFFTGQAAWRALVPSDPHCDAPESRLWMGPEQHVVSYPIGAGNGTQPMTNIVAVQERRQWADAGWRMTDKPENLQAAFAHMGPALRDLLSRVEHTHLWGLFRTEVAPRWYCPNRHIALLGDSAHPTLPFLAQGANLALEDAWVLGALAGHDLQAQDLQAYEQARYPRAKRIIEAANGNARKFHMGGLKRHIGQNGIRLIGALAPQRFMARYDWLYGYDVTARYPIEF